MDLFDTVYTIYTLLVFANTAFRIKFSCMAMRKDVTRRELKVQRRLADVTFGILFIPSVILLLISAHEFKEKDEC